MSLTLLLDLDDTLLINDIETFLPQYISSFAAEVAPYVDADKFVTTLLAGIREMVKNRRPDCTLKEVFDAAFFPTVGLKPDEFQPVADRFYDQVFPSLKKLTRPRPEAVELVEEALRRGYKVVVATNPLFPQNAIQQRLAWANLPAEQYDFELITSLETFHFAKPNPDYFAEVLARIGWPSGPVITVGDDLERDISASRRLGLSAFWIERQGINPPDGAVGPSASGGLGDVLPWLDSTPAEALQSNYSTPSAMLAILRATPAALDSFCRQLPAELWTTQPQKNEWSMTEILCHLRDVDLEVNLPRVNKVLDAQNPFLPGEDTDPWADERQYNCQDGFTALRQYFAARMKLLDLLETITEDDWQRTARHAIFGPTILAELVSIIAGHDRLHLQQIYNLLNKIQYLSTVN